MNKKPNPKSIAKRFQKKLRKIKVLLFDVDGILTDGKIYYDGSEVGWNRSFHALDGYCMKVLMQAGLKVGVITGGDSYSITKRFIDDLKLNYVFKGNEDKREAYLAIIKDGYKDEEILYMGDEFIDLPLLERAGFSATVPNSSLEIQSAVDYVTKRESGDGSAREVMDLIRYAQVIKPHVMGFDA